MTRFDAPTRQRIHEVRDGLSRLQQGTCPVSDVLLPGLARLLDCRFVVAYQLEASELGPQVGWFLSRGLPPGTPQAFETLVEQTPRYGFFDPLRPEPSQRNRALTFDQLMRLTARRGGISAGLKRFFEERGVPAAGQVRTLVCDGDRLLAWFGGFCDGPVTERERDVVAALAEPVRARLTQDVRVGEGGLDAALTRLALEAITAPAFVLTATGRIRHANRPGLAALGLDPELRERLRHDVRHGRSSVAALTKVTAPGVPSYSLAVLRQAPGDPGPRLPSATARWGLTPREAQVLELLASGLSNKSIAIELRCSAATVEIHVSRLLEKSSAESRGALIAQFWRLT